jgi:hypothetical protein
MLERSEPGANGGTRRPARLFRRYFACSQPKSHSPYRPANCLSRFDPTPLLAALQRLVGVRQTGFSLSASAEDLRYEKWKRWLEQITNETHPMRPHRRHRRRDRSVMSLPVEPHGRFSVFTEGVTRLRHVFESWDVSATAGILLRLSS